MGLLKGSGKTIRMVVPVVVLALLSGRLLLIPSETRQRDGEVRTAYSEYCSCLRSDVLCKPGTPCPYPNFMGDFLRRSEEINRRHLILSVLKPRNLLSGWQPRWYTPRRDERCRVRYTGLWPKHAVSFPLGGNPQGLMLARGR